MAHESSSAERWLLVDLAGSGPERGLAEKQVSNVEGENDIDMFPKINSLPFTSNVEGENDIDPEIKVPQSTTRPRTSDTPTNDNGDNGNPATKIVMIVRDIAWAQINASITTEPYFRAKGLSGTLGPEDKTRKADTEKVLKRLEKFAQDRDKEKRGE